MAQQSTLTDKQAAFLAEYHSNGRNGTQAALKAYDTTDPATAAVLASRTLNSANVAAVNRQLAQSIGLTPLKILSQINSSLDADKRYVDPVTQVTQFEPDHATRLRAVEIGSKLLGLQPSTYGEAGGPGGGPLVNINLNGLAQEHLDAVLSGAKPPSQALDVRPVRRRKKAPASDNK